MSRIRFTGGVPIPEALWGANTFGGPITWGQEASDAATALVYKVVPLPQGYPQEQGWTYRVGDTVPDIQFRVMSVEGSIDTDPIDDPQFILDRAGVPHRITLHCDAVDGLFSYQLAPEDLDEAGNYRVIVRLVMASGRVLTVPTDDRTTFTIAEVS